MNANNSLANEARLLVIEGLLVYGIGLLLNKWPY